MRRNPAAPFTTSTLQQEASRKLGFSAKQTMQVAQRLYEGVEIDGEVTGLITYMRTDGVTIIPEAIDAIRGLIEQDYSRRYLPPFIREYKAKAKNAQEAHEAIRPTDARRKPEEVARYLERDQARLYELIWKRAVASQMASAELEQTTAEIEVPGRDGKAYGLRATGSVVTVRRLPASSTRRAATTAAPRTARPTRRTDEDDSRRLPPLAQGDALKDRGIEAKQHFTEPPPRFTEATLVKRMEELGIGRPSTYASTLAVLEDRDYVTHRPQAPGPPGQGPAGHGVPGELLQALRGVRLHGRPGGEARPHLRRQARIQGRAARLLARLHAAPWRASRTCASARCWRR